MSGMPARIQLAARRKALGYSQESLAQAIQVTTSAVARWEQGTSTPKAIYRQPLAKILEITPVDLEGLLDVEGRQITGVNGHHVPSWLGHYASLEQSASRVRTFEPLVVPALLQTTAYAHEIESAYHLPVTDEEIARRAEVRLARQGVLERMPDPLQLSCIIDEAVLHRAPGNPSTMIGQLEHLVAMGQQENIDIRVITFEDGVPGVAFGAFQLLTSPGSTEPYIACSEDLIGKRYHDSAGAVTAYQQLFDHLGAAALDPVASIDLMKTMQRKRATDDYVP